MGKSTTTATTAESFSVDHHSLDVLSSGEQIITYPQSTKYQGYLRDIPEYKSALYAFGIWVVGKGHKVSIADQVILDKIDGTGNQVISSILLDHFVMSKNNGDSFLEIIRNKNGTLVNLLAIGSERMATIKNNGRIVRYEVLMADGKIKKLKPNQVFHKSNERMASEDTGTSLIISLQWVLDAIQEAMRDGRKVFHRNVFPLQIIEYDGNNIAKRDELLVQYADAIANGTALVVPKGVITISNAEINIQDPIAWIRFLQGYFYQVIRISRLIATSEGATELDSKMGYLSFEPMYTYEQNVYEGEIWNQLAIRIKFNRPASIGGTVQEDEAKNTGQVGLQPNDVEATITQE